MSNLKALSKRLATRLAISTRATVAVVAMAATVGSATQAKAVTTYEAEVICPIDGKKFTATLMGSTASTQSGPHAACTVHVTFSPQATRHRDPQVSHSNPLAFRTVWAAGEARNVTSAFAASA